MITKEQTAEVSKDLPLRDFYKPGEEFVVPGDMYMYRGHAFKTDPQGGIFREGTTFVVEEFETLENEKRGTHTDTPDEQIAFTAEPVVGQWTRTQFIVKP